MLPERIERAAALLERLFDDPALLARFRERPGAVLREAGLQDLARATGEGPLNEPPTLDERVLPSGLAGLFAAVAAEGFALAQLVDQAHAQAGPAVPGAGDHAPQAPGPPAEAPAPPPRGPGLAVPPHRPPAPARRL